MLHITVDSHKLAELVPALTQLVHGLALLEARGAAVECSMEPDSTRSDEVLPLEEHKIEPENLSEHALQMCYGPERLNGKTPPWGNTETAMARLREALTALPEMESEFRASDIFDKLPKEVRPRDASTLSSMLANLLKTGFLLRKNAGVYVRP